MIYGNVPNRDLITNLTPGCCVELPCLVDRNGIQPVRIGALPPQLAALCQSNIAVQDLTVEAALTNRREHIYHAVMMDPNTASTLTLDQIWAMCDELIEAHQKDGYLGDFHPVVANTGRAYRGTGDRVMIELLPDASLDLEKPGEGVLKLVAENPGAEPLKTTVLVDIPKHFTAQGKTQLKIEVPAGKSVEQNLPVAFSEAIPEPVKFSLTCDHPAVFCRDLILTPRKSFPLDEKGVASFQVFLAGDSAMEGTLEKEGDQLKLRGRVLDSDIQSVILGQWGIKKGSGLEWLVESETAQKVKTALILAPGKEKDPQILNLQGEAIEGATITGESDAISYHFEASVPATYFGIQASDSTAYVDLRCRLGALGDAHSGGLATLTGVSHRFKAAASAWKFPLQ